MRMYYYAGIPAYKIPTNMDVIYDRGYELIKG